MKYHRFLIEVERKFADERIGKTTAEQRAMLQLTQRILESFAHLYGEGGTSRTLHNDARSQLITALSMN